MRHCLKHVNRCEASVGCCDRCGLLLIGPIILEDHMTGHNYLQFPQNELPEQLEDVLWLHGLLYTFSMTEPLIIPDM
jgi:hypothetical protein